MLNIAFENEYQTYVFVILKTYPSILNYFSATSLTIAQKVSPGQRKIIFLFIESVPISLCGFVCERAESCC